MTSNCPTKMKSLKLRGVVYDVGLQYSAEVFSVDPFDPALVEQDMRSIAKDLHANAVRIEGDDIHRLVIASRAAHANGLAVYFNPWKMNATAEETNAYVAEAARAAEKLRLEGVEIAMLVGCEYTIFSKGVFPGDSFAERCAFLGSQMSHDPASIANPSAALQEKSKDLNKVLGMLASTARASFNGPLTYSSGTWEVVDWDLFGIVGIDYYRRGESAEEYVKGLDRYRIGEKPLVVMEIGCCTYEGAGPRGDGGFMLLKGVNEDGTANFGAETAPTRNETEQADYVETQVGLLEEQGLEGAFVFVFSFPTFRLGEGKRDLDMMAFSLMKTWPKDDARAREMPPWAPKEAYHRLADVYGRMAGLESSG